MNVFNEEEQYETGRNRKRVWVDSEIFGKRRLIGLNTMIKNEVRAGNGFTNLETYRNHRD